MQGFTSQQVSAERFLNLRYDGTDVAVMTPCSTDAESTAAAFEAQASSNPTLCCADITPLVVEFLLASDGPVRLG